MTFALTTEPTQTRRYNTAEFEEFLNLPENQDRLFELIEGEIVEKTPTEEHGSIASTISYFLTQYARNTKKGIVGVDVRYGIAKDKGNSRLPALSYTLRNHAPVSEEAVQTMPDLAVEIQSTDEAIKAIRDKAEYYLFNGAQIVWLIEPQHRMVEVYTLDTIEVRGLEDVLTGGDLLPDFLLPVKQIFTVPFGDV